MDIEEGEKKGKTMDFHNFVQGKLMVWLVFWFSGKQTVLRRRETGENTAENEVKKTTNTADPYGLTMDRDDGGSWERRNHKTWRSRDSSMVEEKSP